MWLLVFVNIVAVVEFVVVGVGRCLDKDGTRIKGGDRDAVRAGHGDRQRGAKRVRRRARRRRRDEGREGRRRDEGHEGDGATKGAKGDGAMKGAKCRERSSRHLEFQLSREQVLVNLP